MFVISRFRVPKGPLSILRRFRGIFMHHQEVQRIAQNIAKTDLKPIAHEIDRYKSIPQHILEILRDAKLLSVCIRREYGGLGLDTLALSLVVEELSKECASTGALVSIHNCLYANLIQRKGTAKQIERLLLPVVASGSIGVFALSEADAGSDVVALKTNAKKEDGSWVLNGRKTWVTSARLGQFGVFFATVDFRQNHKGITAFIVPLSESGVVIEREENKLGIRGTSTCPILLDNVKVPCNNILGEVGDGFKIAMEQLEQGRIGIASQALGIASTSIDRTVDFMRQTHKFDQLSKMKLAEMGLRFESARLLVHKAATKQDEFPGKSNTKWSSMAKLAASECATFNSHAAMQIIGYKSALLKNSVERLFRDSRITEIYGGVTDIQKLVIADQILRKQ